MIDADELLEVLGVVVPNHLEQDTRRDNNTDVIDNSSDVINFTDCGMVKIMYPTSDSSIVTDIVKNSTNKSKNLLNSLIEENKMAAVIEQSGQLSQLNSSAITQRTNTNNEADILVSGNNNNNTDSGVNLQDLDLQGEIIVPQSTAVDIVVVSSTPLTATPESGVHALVEKNLEITPSSEPINIHPQHQALFDGKRNRQLPIVKVASAAPTCSLNELRELDKIRTVYASQNCRNKGSEEKIWLRRMAKLLHKQQKKDNAKQRRRKLSSEQQQPEHQVKSPPAKDNVKKSVKSKVSNSKIAESKKPRTTKLIEQPVFRPDIATPQVSTTNAIMKGKKRKSTTPITVMSLPLMSVPTAAEKTDGDLKKLNVDVKMSAATTATVKKKELSKEKLEAIAKMQAGKKAFLKRRKEERSNNNSSDVLTLPNSYKKPKLQQQQPQQMKKAVDKIMRNVDIPDTVAERIKDVHLTKKFYTNANTFTTFSKLRKGQEMTPLDMWSEQWCWISSDNLSEKDRYARNLFITKNELMRMRTYAAKFCTSMQPLNVEIERGSLVMIYLKLLNILNPLKTTVDHMGGFNRFSTFAMLTKTVPLTLLTSVYDAFYENGGQQGSGARTGCGRNFFAKKDDPTVFQLVNDWFSKELKLEGSEDRFNSYLRMLKDNRVDLVKQIALVESVNKSCESVNNFESLAWHCLSMYEKEMAQINDTQVRHVTDEQKQSLVKLLKHISGRVKSKIEPLVHNEQPVVSIVRKISTFENLPKKNIHHKQKRHVKFEQPVNYSFEQQQQEDCLKDSNNNDGYSVHNNDAEDFSEYDDFSSDDDDDNASDDDDDDGTDENGSSDTLSNYSDSEDNEKEEVYEKPTKLFKLDKTRSKGKKTADVHIV